MYKSISSLKIALKLRVPRLQHWVGEDVRDGRGGGEEFMLGEVVVEMPNHNAKQVCKGYLAL